MTDARVRVGRGFAKSIFLPAMFCFLIACAAEASAGHVAVTITPGEALADADTSGWRFLVLEDIYVTDLGVWDENSNGLPSAVDVGLWDNSGRLLDSTVVAAGDGGQLDEGFRFTSVEPFLLEAGEAYIVAASPQSGELEYQGAYAPPTPMGVADVIVFDEGRYAGSTNTLTFPTYTPSTFPEAFFGGNFRYVRVPEPSTLALGMVALLAQGVCGRRKRR